MCLTTDYTDEIADFPCNPWLKSSSEFVLQSKLHLPRRSRISRRKARAGDNPKRRATNLRCPSGLAEVRVIEHVKDFPAEFDHLRFSQLRTLNKRQVCVVEAWSNHYVSSHATEVIDGLPVYKLDRQDYGRA